jgi:exodeoxyribonuclease V alpha subunit
MSKSNKDVSSNLFQKYVVIRRDHSPKNDFIEKDLTIVCDKKFIHIELLSKCDIHPNSLFKLLNVFRNKPECCFSEIVVNPYKFVLLPDNVFTFEKAHDIAERFHLDIDKHTIYKAWIYDFILFKNNQYYLNKNLLISKFVEYFPDCDTEILTDICMKIKYENKILYTLDELYKMELEMGDHMIELFYNTNDSEPIDISTFVSTYETEKNIIFTKKQHKAISIAVHNKFSVVCGLPGTGKSTIVDCICNYYKDEIICLTGPTGMAVNNIRNKCTVKNCIIGTIHKLLFDGFYDVKEYPKLMIIDEFSMVDNVLFHKVLKWCKVFQCKLILLADDQQLPPIGGGYPLGALIKSKLFKVSNLKTIKRQDKGFLKNVILKLNNGEQIVNEDFDKKSIFFYNYSEDNLVKLIKKFSLTATNCQIISPQHKHNEGTINVNKFVQSIYSKNNPPIYSNRQNKNNIIRDNDLVVRNVNNYTETDLYANGDIAYVKRNMEDNCIDVKYVHTNLKQQITPIELYEEFNLAYCLTVHKVQGSQYDNIVLIIGDNHKFSWTNNDAKKLLYTAISRARERCFILGSSNLFSVAQTIEAVTKPTFFLKRFNSYEF